MHHSLVEAQLSLSYHAACLFLFCSLPPCPSQPIGKFVGLSDSSGREYVSRGIRWHRHYFPDITPEALAKVTPIKFVNLLIQANPKMASEYLTTYNIMCVFTCMRALLLQKSANPELRAQHQICLKQWNASPEWAFIQQIHGKKERISRFPTRYASFRNVCVV